MRSLTAHLSALLLAVAAAGLASLARAAEWPEGAPGVAQGGSRWLGPKPPADPRRIVSLAPSLTDTVVALGHADRLVGVTRYDEAPEVAKLPRVGGFLDPSTEAVVALRPDLVLWLTDAGGYAAARRLAALGIPVLAVPLICVSDIFATTRLIGSVLRDPAAGDRLARSLEATVEELRRRAAGLPRVRTLLVVGHKPLVVAGPTSFPGELLAIAGGENVAQGSRPWAALPLEKAVHANPDLVIDSAMNEPASTLDDLSAIPAIRRGAVRRLATDDLLHPGPRLGIALRELFAALHPEKISP
jgi:iron complex transport system substrate-binding protein